MAAVAWRDSSDLPRLALPSKNLFSLSGLAFRYRFSSVSVSSGSVVHRAAEFQPLYQFTRNVVIFDTELRFVLFFVFVFLIYFIFYSFSYTSLV